jgi:hypothetical protein
MAHLNGPHVTLKGPCRLPRMLAPQCSRAPRCWRIAADPDRTPFSGNFRLGGDSLRMRGRWCLSLNSWQGWSSFRGSLEGRESWALAEQIGETSLIAILDRVRIVQSLMRSLVIEDLSKTVELLLPEPQRQSRRPSCLFLEGSFVLLRKTKAQEP